MTTKVVQDNPSGAATMLKAALPVLPGVNLLPGIAKKGGDLPDLTLVREGIAVDPAHVAAYARVCEFPTRQHLPLTYPHLLSFPLQMAIMTDASFPYPAIGSVHLANTITQHRQIRLGETLGVTVRPANRHQHAKGTVFDLVTEVRADGETVWESTSQYLRVGRGDPEAPAERDRLEIVPPGPITWRLPADLGRRYAAVSGDHNPIHLYGLTAKAFGFKQQIAHGMCTLARSVAALDNRLPEAATVVAEFKKPVFLPAKVAFGSRIGHDDVEFSLTRPKDGAPHLVGRASAL
ncbi:hypothetical protein D9V37_11975 [Nocardioides mangrovicus]|uniref:MaoC-like domain-containing protein n=1 Tax=Nocardioides mangrovicus TaxID=2478913 RepID=A0A3L8P497_9ACTN|nr:MaoC/PaaZ C-terminal domain-containing protein [Nocardioides mangrovicus]RLV49258.1 hypothetical protein D9V37_11975 [Nocardioides mangrovicus]